MRYLQSVGPISRSDWVKGAAYTVAFAVIAIGGPNLALKDHDSPYRFTKDQVGPYADRS
ncbi:hypothetical protein [Streptomyces sp. NPDC014746]|uniref:hypothetical protein n=1 Tax=Streptomyces sp. NPDC014746 TaxID=3364904 RepID=UPI0036F84F5E